MLLLLENRLIFPELMRKGVGLLCLYTNVHSVHGFQNTKLFITNNQHPDNKRLISRLIVEQ